MCSPGLGIAVLSQPSMRLELAAGEMVVLDVQGFPLRRRWYAVHHKGKRLSRAAQTFLEYLQLEGEEEVRGFLGGEGRGSIKDARTKRVGVTCSVVFYF